MTSLAKINQIACDTFGSSLVHVAQVNNDAIRHIYVDCNLTGGHIDKLQTHYKILFATPTSEEDHKDLGKKSLLVILVSEAAKLMKCRHCTKQIPKGDCFCDQYCFWDFKNAQKQVEAAN